MNFPTGHIEHHFHQVLTDVVHITLDAADNHLGVEAGFVFGYVRAQNVEPCIQCIGAHQHFRNEVLVAVIQVANDLHSGCQTVHDHFERNVTVIQRLLCGFLDHVFLVFDYTCLQFFQQFCFGCHILCLSFVWVC